MAQQSVSTLPLLPLTTGVVLPQMVVTIPLESPAARAAAEAGDSVLLVPVQDGRYSSVGTVAQIEERAQLPNGVRVIVVHGLRRALVRTGVPGTGDATWVEAEEIEQSPPTARDHELAREYRAVVENILEARGATRVAEALRGVSDPGTLADTAGWSPDLSLDQKIEILETLDVTARLEKVLGWAREALADLDLKQRIRSEVAEGMEKQQREFLLRRQLEAIQKELGEEPGGGVSDYRARLAERNFPDAVREAVEKEIDRLERTNEQSPEHGWIRTWLDWQFDLPWGVTSDERLDPAAARETLDADHTGLDDVKERIVEYLAVRKLRTERGLNAHPDGQTPRRGDGVILALTGPPGVGKTSMGESVARALGRSFVRVALGGIRDEAEVRGHRRTYVGAQPGRIARAIKEAGTMNPVFLLDEVDKLGADWRGDPSSALLEVLDPAQNHSFRDHYLEVDLDLSQVLFIATANVVEAIPGPLLDRMEVVRLDGYTTDEKVEIARDHLLARQCERNGLRPDEITVTDDALRTVIEDYTREAGVRSLERAIGKVVRKAALKIASGETGITVGPDEVGEYLGRPKFFHEAAQRTSVPGVATGLAVTGTGGDVLFVETSAMPGEGPLAMTGQLGDVMRESAEIALSLVRSKAPELGVDESALSGRRVHVHVPAGAVPKDGPSAGVTMTTALVSLLSGRTVRPDVGMTGEVTLQGRVLPVGGIKQKVLAAHRAGLREVILPALNEGDLDEVPESVREEMKFVFASEIGDVLAAALASKSPTAASDAA